MTYYMSRATQYIRNLIILEVFYLKFYHFPFTLTSNTAHYITIIIDNSLVYRVTISEAA
jgi:hypothetical protein